VIIIDRFRKEAIAHQRIDLTKFLIISTLDKKKETKEHIKADKIL